MLTFRDYDILVYSLKCNPKATLEHMNKDPREGMMLYEIDYSNEVVMEIGRPNGMGQTLRR